MTETERRRAVALTALLAVVVTVAATGAVAAQSTPTADNTTVQHERPDSLQADGDSEQVAAWLEGRLADRLGESTVALSEGEYEQAKSAVGPEYRNRLGQYVDVAGETDAYNDSSAALGETREAQRSLANRTQAYERERERYERARANGNVSGARAHAREMERLAAGIERDGENVTSGYETIESRTGVDTDDSRERIGGLVENVSGRQETVRTETFVETDLTVTAPTDAISFGSPLEARGTLVASNGSAIANRSVTVAVAGRPRTVRTDADGQFSVTHRPQSLSLDADNVTVAFRPGETSPYLPTETDVPVEVVQERPSLSIRNRTETATAGDPVALGAVLTVGDVPVADAPLRMTVDGETIATGRTDADGAAILQGSLPASVPAGDRTVRVTLPYREQALASANATATLSVASTPTNLTVDAGSTAENATLTGRLATADGRPAADRVVTISRDGAVLGSTRTDENGRYQATVSLPPAASQRENATTVSFDARFAGEGTSLEPASASAALTVGGGPAGITLESLLDRLDSLLPVSGRVSALALVGVLLALALTGLWWRRRGDDAAESAAPATPSARTDDTTADDDATQAFESDIEQAQTFLERGAAAAAVRATYAAVRDLYAGETDPRTHWELLDRSESLSPAEREALWLVVTAYEEAAFSTTAVDEERARSVLGAARDVAE